jgi:hypothetical protein
MCDHGKRAVDEIQYGKLRLNVYQEEDVYLYQVKRVSTHSLES